MGDFNLCSPCTTGNLHRFRGEWDSARGGDAFSSENRTKATRFYCPTQKIVGKGTFKSVLWNHNLALGSCWEILWAIFRVRPRRGLRLKLPHELTPTRQKTHQIRMTAQEWLVATYRAPTSEAKRVEEGRGGGVS